MGNGCEAIGEVPFDLVSFFILALLVHHCGLSEWDSHYSCLNYLMQFLLVALDSPLATLTPCCPSLVPAILGKL